MLGVGEDIDFLPVIEYVRHVLEFYLIISGGLDQRPRSLTRERGAGMASGPRSFPQF
jgi:hypothetical protein